VLKIQVRGQTAHPTDPLMRFYRKDFITIDGMGVFDGVFTRVLRALRQ
jgi:hypothetical protein